MLDERQIAARRAAVENAIATQRLEGLELDALSVAALDRYARGELEIANLLTRARARVATGAFRDHAAE